MAGKSAPMSNTAPAIGGLQVQTSTYGIVQALLWGRPRVPGNLLWYGDFKAIARTETSRSGGKGGGARQTTTTYSYQAAVAMGIAAGPINGIVSAWRGKVRVLGQPRPLRIRTLRHRVVVPVGGVVAVPDAASVVRNVAVRSVANDAAGRS